MTRIEALEAVAEAARVVMTPLRRWRDAGRIDDDTMALFAALDALDAIPPATEPSTPRWPNGCTDPNSCAKSGTCNYFGCVHYRENIGPAVEEAVAALKKMRPKPATETVTLAVFEHSDGAVVLRVAGGPSDNIAIMLGDWTRLGTVTLEVQP